MKAKTSIIGLKDLRENTEAYIKRVNRGESFTVLRRSTPVFRLAPIDSEETGWETVIDFTKINAAGVSGHAVLAALKKMHG